jgi:hypothetical protein
VHDGVAGWCVFKQLSDGCFNFKRVRSVGGDVREQMLDDMNKYLTSQKCVNTVTNQTLPLLCKLK